LNTAQRISREIIRDKSKSFYTASLLLPRHQRHAAMVVYAWCRRADDTVDEGHGDRRADLERLRRELDDIEEGRRTGHAIVDGFGEVVRQFQIPLLYPRELLAGMEQDLAEVRYRSIDGLLQYCYRVAGTVGLMMTHVMGVDDDDAVENAAHLGVAMQLTNICRDVEEDWNRGRLYLPEDLLARHGAETLGQRLGGDFPREAARQLSQTIDELLELADRYYESGDRGLSRLPWRSSVAISAARKIYSEIGAELRRRHCDPTLGRAFVTGRRKVRLVADSLAARALDLLERQTSADNFTSPSRSLAFAEMPRL
jgi:phytoene synthase